MQAFDAFCTIVSHSGKPKESLSRELGRNKKFIGSIMSRGTIPGTVLFAEIADICGYDLTLVKRDGTETVTIDPPERRPDDLTT